MGKSDLTTRLGGNTDRGGWLAHPLLWGRILPALGIALALMLPFLQPFLEGYPEHPHYHAELEKIAGFGVLFPLASTLAVVAAGHILVFVCGDARSCDRSEVSGSVEHGD